MHGIVCRGETVNDLVPRCGAGEEDLDDDASEVHVSKDARPEVQDFFGAEEPNECSDNEWEHEVDDTIRKPSDDVKDRVREASEDI